MGGNTTVTVIGIMKQSAFNGVFIKSDYVRNNLEVNGTNLFLIKLAGDADADKQATLIQNQFWQYGVSTIAMKTLAKQVVSQIDGIFNLIKAFLALGLIIGITGLGIITIRSIHERRIEIGMMRAIGYTKRMVVANFALESAFVSVLGILIGSVLGIIVGYQLWETSFSDHGDRLRHRLGADPPGRGAVLPGHPPERLPGGPGSEQGVPRRGPAVRVSRPNPFHLSFFNSIIQNGADPIPPAA